MLERLVEKFNKVVDRDRVYLTRTLPAIAGAALLLGAVDGSSAVQIFTQTAGAVLGSLAFGYGVKAVHDRVSDSRGEKSNAAFHLAALGIAGTLALGPVGGYIAGQEAGDILDSSGEAAQAELAMQAPAAPEAPLYKFA